MKNNKFLLIIFGLCAMLMSQAQAPEKIDFQAMARDASGNPLVDQDIGVQITIKQGGPTGTVVYQEEHSTTTNSYGLFVLAIGDGNPVSGTFAAIDWTSGNFYTQVEVDQYGGTNYINMGTMEMMSVPFSLYAERAGYGEDDDADPNNEFQTITESGNTITLSHGGGTITDDTEDADADPANEIQTISESGNEITLSNGGGTVTDNVEDADADPGNEIQSLSFSGGNLSISPGNSVIIPSSAWGQSGNNIYYSSGNVGVGTNSPNSKLDILGDINSTVDYKLNGSTILSSPGTQNILVGLGAGENNTNNTATFVGYNAGKQNQGGWNTFIGCESGKDNTSGDHNTFVGRQSGSANTTGVRNTFIGSNTGRNTTEGQYNVFIGYIAGNNNTTGSRNVFIGYQAGYSETGSNKLYIDNTTTGNPLIYGEFDNDLLAFNADVGIGTTDPVASLDVNGDVKIGENGMVISEILELTGTTTSYNSTEISYPTGYNLNNTRVLSLDIQNDFSNWVSMGYSVPSIDRSISCVLLDDKMILTIPEISWFLNKPYRITLMKVE